WGPPGVGKTTIARLLADETDLTFVQISAIFTGMPDLRKVFEAAKIRRQNGKGTLLFVDEIHRFNKAQQDGFLPHMEDGTILLVGATTENPSFELNSAVLSRAQVMILNRLTLAEMELLIQRAEKEMNKALPVTADARDALMEMADGDGRALLNLLEQVFVWKGKVDRDDLSKRLSRRAPKYDKSGEEHYNLISALHKSVRGSDPDAALYWFARMLQGGEDPRYLARRITRMAVEDIGLADPDAQRLCLDAWQTYERLGSPEGELALGQAVMYLALAPKSNASYAAYKNAMSAAKTTGSEPPPKHILNAPTAMMKDQGFGDGYQYDHDAEDGFSGQNYFPDTMKRGVYYSPVERGHERELKKRLAYFAKLRAKRKD
ncbi:MAG: replication-associated recombination protein A, partial [Alphaproteobacteria bacterium]